MIVWEKANCWPAPRLTAFGVGLHSSGWAFNRDVFCKPKNGNSLSFLSQRTQRKQSKASDLVNRIVQGPFSEVGPLLLLHLGHRCDQHPSHRCQMQTQGSSTSCWDNAFLYECSMCVHASVCMSMCMQRSGDVGAKDIVKGSCLARTFLSPEVSSS